jgi:hypothetical protein
VTAPTDPRLPGGGGYEICGLADIKPEKFGQIQNLVTDSEAYGKFVSYNDFVNASIDARLPRNIRIGGGVDTGRSVADSCFVIDSPQQAKFSLQGTPAYCRVVTPFSAQTQVKLHGVVPFPGDFLASFAFQNLSGPSYDATYTASNAEIARSLGRPLSGGALTANIPLVPPQTLFENRITRLDLRVSKILRVKRLRVQVNVDAYNALNANSVRAVIGTYGARWRSPQQILDPRLIQIGGQINF